MSTFMKCSCRFTCSSFTGSTGASKSQQLPKIQIENSKQQNSSVFDHLVMSLPRWILAIIIVNRNSFVYCRVSQPHTHFCFWFTDGLFHVHMICMHVDVRQTRGERMISVSSYRDGGLPSLIRFILCKQAEIKTITYCLCHTETHKLSLCTCYTQAVINHMMLSVIMMPSDSDFHWGHCF